LKSTIKIREYDKIIIIDLPEFVNRGREDIDLKSIFMEVIAKNKNVGVNLKTTAHIDCGIVFALLTAERNIQQSGKQLYVIGASAQVKELLAGASINQIIPFINDEKDLL